MGRCQVKQGLFLTGQCNNNTQKTCAACGKWVCKTHAKREDDKTLCAECYVKENSASLQAHDRDFSHWDPADAMIWYHYAQWDFFHHSEYAHFDQEDYEGFEYESEDDFDEGSETDDTFDS